ncbi:MAG: pyrroline-5-carboxylate reductase [Armatimonadota bacterium]|nr:pyrroline-5-carboxylate reductase [Armatimonadota bacterium]
MLGNKKIGFIGAGMMAEAIARGLLSAGVSAEAIIASDPDEKRREVFSAQLGVKATDDNKSVARWADILILAVKPFVMSEVLGEIGSEIKTDQLVISIAAGITTESIQNKLGEDVPVIRVMPNTPALIGKGASALAPGKSATPSHMEIALQIFGAVGKAVQVTEDKMDAVTGLSGSGPAYVYMFIEALADGGVRMGLPRQTAVMLAAQTVAGAAEMVLQTGTHTAELRDRVTTPGGTTIAGIAALEKAGFRSAAIEAVTAATLRSTELGKPNK